MSTITRDNKSFYVVNTTTGTDPAAGFVVIDANLKETAKTGVIPADRKHRNITIPEFVLGETVPKQFQSVLLAKIYELAKSYLADVMFESDRMLKEIPVEEMTIDSLLAYFGRVAVSQRLSAESVAAWFDSSATGAWIKSRAGDDAAKLKTYRDLFVKSAAPNHGINPNTCTALLATLQDADKEHKIYEALATKWQATVTKSQESSAPAL